MMHFARFSPCLLAWSLPLFWGCGDSSAGGATQREISGLVRDASSGRGIADATVELTSDALDRAETSTDEDGQFTLPVTVSDGVLFGNVRAQHPDYEAAPAASVYFDGAENIVQLELRRKPSK